MDADDGSVSQEPEHVCIETDGEDLQASPVLTLNILQTLKTAQAQHGLRHNDYTRYRHVKAQSDRSVEDLMMGH